MSVTIPFLWMDVSADVNATLSPGLTSSFTRSSSTNALGDIVLMPLMLNYNASGRPYRVLMMRILR